MKDARVRIFALFCLGTATVCLERTASLGSLALLTTGLLMAHPRSRGWRLRLAAAFALFAWSTALSQGLFYADWPRTPVLRLGPLVLYREGLVHGLAQSLRFVTVTGGGALLAVSTPPDRLAAGLLAFRLPYGLVLMATAAFRFVPLIAQEWLIVRAARRRRGRPAWSRGPWAWLRLEVAMLRPLAARAMRRARTLAESLDTRGFHPTAPRVDADAVGLGLPDRLLTGALALATCATVAARALHAAYGAELYYAPSLRPLYAFVRAWM